MDLAGWGCGLLFGWWGLDWGRRPACKGHGTRLWHLLLLLLLLLLGSEHHWLQLVRVGIGHSTEGLPLLEEA
jgi:hypothetical protein